MLMRDATMPSTEDVRLAKESSRFLMQYTHDHKSSSFQVRFGKSKTPIELPESAVRLLEDILTAMAQGKAITVIPVNAELTTQQAADLIGVSRPFLIKQLEENAIPFRLVGTHRRVRYDDLMKYKNDIDARREQTLRELASQAEELDMGY